MNMFIGLILIGLLIYWLIKMAPRTQSGDSTASGSRANASTAMSILNERYARGEIGDDEYQHRKSELKNF